MCWDVFVRARTWAAYCSGHLRRGWTEQLQRFRGSRHQSHQLQKNTGRGKNRKNRSNEKELHEESVCVLCLCFYIFSPPMSMWFFHAKPERGAVREVCKVSKEEGEDDEERVCGGEEFRKR